MNEPEHLGISPGCWRAVAVLVLIQAALAWAGVAVYRAATDNAGHVAHASDVR